MCQIRNLVDVVDGMGLIPAKRLALTTHRPEMQKDPVACSKVLSGIAQINDKNDMVTHILTCESCQIAFELKATMRPLVVAFATT
jgi:hypothetical protein